MRGIKDGRRERETATRTNTFGHLDKYILTLGEKYFAFQYLKYGFDNYSRGGGSVRGIKDRRRERETATRELTGTKLQNVFAQITKCICQNCKMYLLQGEGNDHPKGCFALVCHLYVSLDCSVLVCT